MIHELSELFWSEVFWLPPNSTWKEFHRQQQPGQYKPLLWDLGYIIPCAFAIYFARRFVESLIFKPIGKCLGLSDFNYSVSNNTELESFYRKSRKPTDDSIKELSEKLALSPKFISNWMRKRRNKDKSSVLTKFSESGWRLVFYVLACAFGFGILSSKSFFWDTKDCFYGWPHQHVSSDLFWYYMIELGYYFAALVSVFSDVKRKDFKEMLLHHLVTIWLMVFSWVTNFVRIGSLIVMIHDVVDPWLEGAKMAKYVGLHNTCNVLFTSFLILWFVSRLVVYPFRILNAAFFECREILGPYAAHYVFLSGLFTLQILHVIWFFFILRLAYTGLFYGDMAKDTRSESDPSFSDDSIHNGLTKDVKKIR